MRMWMLPPELMCKTHLQGCHGELHKHRHVFEKGHSITNRIYPEPQIEPLSMKARHDELAQYFNHKSPLTQPDLSYLPEAERNAKVNRENSLLLLHERCSACREIILAKGGLDYWLPLMREWDQQIKERRYVA